MWRGGKDNRGLFRQTPRPWNARAGMHTIADRCRRVLGAAVICLSVGLASIAHAADCPDLRITKDVFAPSVSDLAAAIRGALGANARPAEWNEVKACFDKYGLSYFHKIGAVKTDPANKSNPPNSQFLVLVNG
jgi:hypothetical protein